MANMADKPMRMTLRSQNSIQSIHADKDWVSKNEKESNKEKESKSEVNSSSNSISNNSSSQNCSTNNNNNNQIRNQNQYSSIDREHKKHGASSTTTLVDQSNNEKLSNTTDKIKYTNNRAEVLYKHPGKPNVNMSVVLGFG